MEIGLSLGSNLDDRLVYLSKAKGLVADIAGVAVVESSPVYETRPVDVPAEFQHLLFLNAVLIIESPVEIMGLLSQFAEIEEDMGRVREARPNAPRSIDIDIIYAGEETIDRAGVVIPHARWIERLFVVKPLSDLRPDLRLPGVLATVHEILLSLPDSEKLVPFATEW